MRLVAVKQGKRLLLAGWAVLSLASCQAVKTTQPGVVGVEREQHFE
jgi:hypothetical protein